MIFNAHMESMIVCQSFFKKLYAKIHLLKKDIRLVDTIAWELHQVVSFVA